MRLKYCSTPKLLFFCLLAALSGCIEPYEPPVRDVPESFVVVDGFINSQGVSTIKLSRTINLSADTVPPAELGATVYIEAEDGIRYDLPQPNFLTTQNAGTYTSAYLTLDPQKKYRLHFTTAAGREYASDFVPVKTTPPIDNITWQPQEDGLQLYVNSHDASNNTQYYRWRYEETWEYNSAYLTSLEYRDGGIEFRNDNIYVCWNTVPSSTIKISSTTRLNQDVVADYPLVTVPRNSVKLGRRYSILVKQYALSQEEYVYYELLRKNTENIGTLFDPLPTQLTGNVRCVTDAAEPVIGFVGARSETEKRIFVDNEELPTDWYRYTTGYEDCPPLDSIMIDYQVYHTIEQVESSFSSGIYLALYPIYLGMGMPKLVGYTAASVACVDCRLRGTNVRPDFW